MDVNDIYVVVAYDIPDDRRRVRLSRVLAGYGERVQKSVFECALRRSEYEALLERIARMWQEGDAIRVYRLPRSVAAQTRVLGGRGLVETPWLTIISSSTLAGQ